jgi:hypothetical protein
MTRHELPGGERAPMTVFGARNKPWSTQTPAPEDPGDYAFPPIAAVTLEPSAGWERDGLITPKTYREPVFAKTLTHMGKEANQLEGTLTGLYADQSETLNNYDQDPPHHRTARARPATAPRTRTARSSTTHGR